MVTQSAPPPTPTPAPAPAHPHDDFTGAFGFFRKYQKAILYSAGMFALVTFSVTGAMMGFFNNLMKPASGPRPTITVLGKTVEVTQEDFDIGLDLSNMRYQPTLVLPGIGEPRNNRTDNQEVYAILRRAAIAEGLDVSMAEVDRAIEYARASLGLDSATKMAVTYGASSLAHYRMLVKEAMRIGNYVRMQTVGADGSDQAAIEELLDGAEVLTLRVASFSAKKLEEELKKGAITDDDLKKWLDGKDENWKVGNGVYDSNRVALDVGYVLIDQFDATQWTEELKSFTPSEDILKRFYEEEKERQFKIDAEQWKKDHPNDVGPPPPYQVFENEAVQARLKATANAEEVLNGIRKKIADQQNEACKAQNDALRTAADERNKAQMAHDEAKKKADAAPQDEALKTALAEKLKELDAKKAAYDAADKALAAGREAFDFGKAFTDATKDKKGFARMPVTGKDGPLSLDQLKELPELGAWDKGWLATQKQHKGELADMVSRTIKAALIFRIDDVVLKPLKKWDDLKKLLTDAFWTEKANEQAKDKKKAFEEALLRLAKAKIQDKVTEIEGKKQGKVDTLFGEWESKTQKAIEEAQKKVKEVRPGTDVALAWQKELTAQTEALAKKDDKKKSIADEVQKQVDADVKAEAKKKYAEVIEAAATEAGFTMRTIGPLQRDLASVPRFYKRFDEVTRFAFSMPDAKKLKAGEATDVLDDPSNRMTHLVVCDKVEPRPVESLTRRELVEMLEQSKKPGAFTMPMRFRDSRIGDVLEQSFTREALKARYGYKRPGDDQKLSPDPKAPAGK